MIHAFYKVFNFLRRTNQRLLNFSTLGVQAVVINQQQQILLVEHTYIEGWHLPGGGVNSGETPKEAICRELEEEGGLKVNTEDVTLFSIYSHQIEGASDYPIVYIVKKFKIIPNAKKSSEIKQIGWFSPHEIPLNTPIYTQQRIKEYLEELPVSEKW